MSTRCHLRPPDELEKQVDPVDASGENKHEKLKSMWIAHGSVTGRHRGLTQCPDHRVAMERQHQDCKMWLERPRRVANER